MDIQIKIVSAAYGPCEGLRLPTGELTNDKATSIPLSRDVAPFLRSLLIVEQQHQHQRKQLIRKTQPEKSHPCDSNLTAPAATTTSTSVPIATSITNTTMKPSWIHVLGGIKPSMNAVFGDPCPGTSKRLHVHYIVTEFSPGDTKEMKAAKTEVHHVTFAEHDRVVFRRRLTFFQERDDENTQLKAVVERSFVSGGSSPCSNRAKKNEEVGSTVAMEAAEDSKNKDDGSHDESDTKTLQNKDDGSHDERDTKTLQYARRMGRSQSIAEFVALQQQTEQYQALPMQEQRHLFAGPVIIEGSTKAVTMVTNSSQSSLTPSSTILDVPPKVSGRERQQNHSITNTTTTTNKNKKERWRLRSAVSEIVIPLVLPFLDVQERVQSRLICRTWKYVVRDWGVATEIDSNDSTISNFSRPFLRGILAHSHTSLTSLFLSGFESLQKSDLHPAIKHLRNLRTFDVTRCHDLDDSTMILLSQHVHRTLEVLYIKGLRQISDVGVKAVCKSCSKLEVLEISHVPITDDGGIAIAQLSKLRALFMRDNYYLTNASIDVITKNCTRLNQLTLWGCTRIQHLQFGDSTIHHHQSRTSFSPFNCGRLVILNLWGCHGLKDEAAESLGNMENLSSLIVSECHRLTDRFVENLVKAVPNLNHLHLRYCKRLTDSSIYAIAKTLRYLYSLDLSFCTRITSTALSNLLEMRHDCLAELRLKSCRNLVISQAEATSNGRPSIRRSAAVASGSGASRGAGVVDERSNITADGQIILNAIRSPSSDCLCVLDLRDCGGQSSSTAGYPDTDRFVIGMKELKFEQKAPGFFSRASCWGSVQQQLVNQQMQVASNDPK